MSLFGELGTRKELENKAKAEGRLPPGQSLTMKWPVLHYGSIPHFDPANGISKKLVKLEEPKRRTPERLSRRCCKPKRCRTSTASRAGAASTIDGMVVFHGWDGS